MDFLVTLPTHSHIEPVVWAVLASAHPAGSKESRIMAYPANQLPFLNTLWVHFQAIDLSAYHFPSLKQATIEFLNS